MWSLEKGHGVMMDAFERESQTGHRLNGTDLDEDTVEIWKRD